MLGALQKPTKDECLQRWSLLIQEYAIKLCYLEGKANIFADTLSRLPEPISLELDEEFQSELSKRNSFCNPLTEYLPIKLPWSEEQLRDAQHKDSTCLAILKKLNKKDESPKDERVPQRLILDSRIINQIVYIIRRIKRTSFYDVHLVIYVPDSLMSDALRITHEELLAGHKGPERTLKLFILNFYNRRERWFVTNHCKQCEACIRAKGVTKKVPIKTYPVPTRPFHTVTSDILGPLGITESGNQYIITFRDYVTRFTILFPMPGKTTSNIIKCLRHVISTHGSMSVFLTDNAKEYKATQLNDFLRYYNARKVEVSPYHPASAGLAERINREINKLLRIFVDEYALNDWDQLLPTIQLTINCTYNSSIKETPFYALFGYDGASTALNPPRISYQEDGLDQHMRRIVQVRDFCRQRLLKAQEDYTNNTNKGRREKNIEVGQRVFARTDKHQSGTKKKLDLPISGPFKVLQRAGPLSWTLEEVSTGKRLEVHADYIVGRSVKEHPIEPQPETSESEEEDSPTPSQWEPNTTLPPAKKEGGSTDQLPPESGSPTMVQPPPVPQQAEAHEEPVEDNTEKTAPRLREQPSRACKKGPKYY